MSRRTAREVALQALFQLDFNESETLEAVIAARNRVVDSKSTEDEIKETIEAAKDIVPMLRKYSRQ